MLNDALTKLHLIEHQDSKEEIYNTVGVGIECKNTLYGSDCVYWSLRQCYSEKILCFHKENEGKLFLFIWFIRFDCDDMLPTHIRHPRVLYRVFHKSWLFLLIFFSKIFVMMRLIFSSFCHNHFISNAKQVSAKLIITFSLVRLNP